MRVCGGFLDRKPLSCPKGAPDGSAAGQSVGSALLPIDHADRDSALQAGFAKTVERLDRGAARGDDVLDEQTRSPGSYAPRGGPHRVVLRLLRTIRNGRPEERRRCSGEGDRAQLRAGEPHCIGLVLGDRRRDVLTEGGQRSGRVSKRYLSR